MSNDNRAGVWRDLDGSRKHYYTEYRLTDFFVDLKRAPEWITGEATLLPNVRSVRGRVRMQVLIDLPGLEAPISGMAISMPLRAQCRSIAERLVAKSSCATCMK